MKIVFAESKWEELQRIVRENNYVISHVELTKAEYISVYDELVSKQDANCIFLPKRYVFIDTRNITLKVL
jgi:hypothetical protein